MTLTLAISLLVFVIFYKSFVFVIFYKSFGFVIFYKSFGFQSSWIFVLQEV